MLQTLEREPQEGFHGLSGGLSMTHGGPHGKKKLLFVINNR